MHPSVLAWEVLSGERPYERELRSFTQRNRGRHLPMDMIMRLIVRGLRPAIPKSCPRAAATTTDAAATVATTAAAAGGGGGSGGSGGNDATPLLPSRPNANGESENRIETGNRVGGATTYTDNNVETNSSDDGVENSARDSDSSDASEIYYSFLGQGVNKDEDAHEDESQDNLTSVQNAKTTLVQDSKPAPLQWPEGFGEQICVRCWADQASDR